MSKATELIKDRCDHCGRWVKLQDLVTLFSRTTHPDRESVAVCEICTDNPNYNASYWSTWLDKRADKRDWIGLKEAAEIIGIKRRGMLKRITDGIVPEGHYKREEHPVYGVTWYVTREYAESNPYIPQSNRPKKVKNV